MRRALLSAVLSLSVLLSTLAAAQDASYTFTTINIPSSVNDTYAVGINNHGQIVGYYSTSGSSMSGFHGFLYNQGVFKPRQNIAYAGAELT
jgi:probable HAF family extracellular repeat protein